MFDHSMPKVLVSKCLGFDSCRYNGGIISSDVVEALGDHVEFKPVCPEVGIGLGVPRETLRLVEGENEPRLVQTETERDCTKQVKRFAKDVFSELAEIDGAILKSRSPSCGTNDVKVYTGLDKSEILSKSSGVFASAVQNHYSDKPIENEGRLRNFRIRENFYTSIFALARFRHIVEGKKKVSSLTDFHAKHKFLLMAYDQQKMRKLGRIAANIKNEDVGKIIKDYENTLAQLLCEPPSPGSHINVLQHAYGYFSGELNTEEKSLFEEYIHDYRSGTVPLSTVISLIRSWITRFNQQYLQDQRYFDPYPQGLVEISDSGKGRDF